MAKRIEVLLNKIVWPIAFRLEKLYKKQEIWLSAAVLALVRLSPEDREEIFNEINEERLYKLSEFKRLYDSMSEDEQNQAIESLHNDNNIATTLVHEAKAGEVEICKKKIDKAAKSR